LITSVDPMGHSGIVTRFVLFAVNPAAIWATPLLKLTAGDEQSSSVNYFYGNKLTGFLKNLCWCTVCFVLTDEGSWMKFCSNFLIFLSSSKGF